MKRQPALAAALCALLSAAPARADIGRWLSDGFEELAEIPAYLFGGAFEENCPRTTRDLEIEGEVAADHNIICAGMEHGLSFEGPLTELTIGAGEVLQWIWVNAAIVTRVGEMQAHLGELDVLQAATNGDASNAGATATLGRMRENVDLLRAIHQRLEVLQEELNAEHQQMTSRRGAPVNDASDMVTPALIQASNEFREERLAQVRALRAARLEILQQTPLLLESSVSSLITGSSRPSDDAFNAGIRNAIGSARTMTQARITRYMGVLDEERRLGDEANAIEYENLGADTPGAGEGAGAEGASSTVRGSYSGFILNTLQDEDLLRELVATSDPTLIPGCERLVWAGCRLQNRLLGADAHAVARDFAINVALTIGSAGFSAGMVARSASSLARMSNATAFAATEITGLVLDLSAADAAEARCTDILTSIRSGVSGRVGEYETCLQEASDARAMALISAAGLAGSFGEVVQASRLGRARGAIVPGSPTPPPSALPSTSALPSSTSPAALTVQIWDRVKAEFGAVSATRLDNLQADASYQLDTLGIDYVESSASTMYGDLIGGADASRVRLLQIRGPSAPNMNPIGPLTPAVDHPGMAGLISEMDGLGPPPVQICVDPSLSGAERILGYFRPGNPPVIAIRPGATWTTLLHEAQHARFDSRLGQWAHLDRRSVLGSAIVRADVHLDDAELTQLQGIDPMLADAYRLARDGHGFNAVNETLAVSAELEALATAGYEQLSSVSLRTRLYALEHQVADLRAAAAPLNQTQSSALLRAERERLLTQTILAASDRTPHVFTAGLPAGATGPAAVAQFGMVPTSTASVATGVEETFGGARVYFSSSRGTYVIRALDGTIRGVSPDSLAELFPDSELQEYRDSETPPTP